MLDKVITATGDNAALVKAAVDWERTGLTRPIPKPQLEELWQTYGHQRRPLLASHDRFETALKWATTFLEDSDSASYMRSRAVTTPTTTSSRIDTPGMESRMRPGSG